MKVALVDNGSLEPAAHECLRATALALGERAGTRVEAVSWKHSDRIEPGALGGVPAWTLAPWIGRQVSAGEREFLFVPFFISPQGSIGSALRGDLERLRGELGGFDYAFTDGLSAEVDLPGIVAARVREAAASGGLRMPAVIVVDHGGPSRASAGVRDQVAELARALLKGEVRSLQPASMESPGGPQFDFNRPLLADVLAAPGFDSGDVLVAPLFLSPGRHAGPGGDLFRIADAARARAPLLRCHFTKLVGSHPVALEALAGALARALRAEARR